MNNFDSTTIEAVIMSQSEEGEFVCRHCRHWEGGCACAKNYFIAAEGMNLEGCLGYGKENRERKHGHI